MRPISAFARRAKAEIARIPVFAPLWKDFLTRLRATDPDLFEARGAAGAL